MLDLPGGPYLYPSPKMRPLMNPRSDSISLPRPHFRSSSRALTIIHSRPLLKSSKLSRIPNSNHSLHPAKTQLSLELNLILILISSLKRIKNQLLPIKTLGVMTLLWQHLPLRISILPYPNINNGSSTKFKSTYPKHDSAIAHYQFPRIRIGKPKKQWREIQTQKEKTWKLSGRVI